MTIAEPVSFSGIGLHTGNLTTLTFKPAPKDSGITFYRTDLPGRPAIRADVDNVVDVSRGTTIANGEARVHTIEHVLAAVFGMGIDNLDIEVDANETPVGDGSSLPFLNVLKRAGVQEQDAEKKYVKIEEPVYYRNGDVTLSVLPFDELRVTMTIAFDHVAIGTQYASFTVTPETFEHEIASARTFCFLREVKALQDKGLIRGGSLDNAVVIGDESILNDTLRYRDEFVRHKVLDLLGDMFLLGRPLKGHIVGVKSGHAMHVHFAKSIKKALINGSAHSGTLRGLSKPRPVPAINVNRIMKLLPHRYPFLLVDRIVSYTPFEYVQGIKNVTINEPFFQGHWPRNPVMPGVLIIEAMAQVSSVLIVKPDGEKTHPHAYFLSIENAKFRRAVVPGDQLIIESTTKRMRRNALRVKSVARVDGQVVTEAEMTFALSTEPMPNGNGNGDH
jgi:UDP-3-O-[3-hydroxymyristoyl] N-acetylglucosamine deacetylase/3-hydroxyacyl-[acyl-carrier-protein] dehydratase